MPCERALREPRRELARQLRQRIAKLTERNLKVLPPPWVHGPGPAPRRTSIRTTIGTFQVTAAFEQRKRLLGDEGERWALAAVIDPLLALEFSARAKAVTAIDGFAGTFNGPPVDRARAHGRSVLDDDLDSDELVEELAGFLHVANYSAEFGFDLFALLPPHPGAAPIPMCVEVKSSVDGSFFLSAGEWSRAQQFAEADQGEHYAVLVVRRPRSDGTPLRLDLLVDPVELVTSGQLLRKVDTYKVTYQSSRTPDDGARQPQSGIVIR